MAPTSTMATPRSAFPDSVDQRALIPNATNTAMIANPNLGRTNAQYLSGGLYGLNCPAVGGCTNSQVFPTPPELNTLLNSRGATLGGVFYPGANQPFQINKFLTQVGERYLDNRSQTSRSSAA